jgi:hypothetical protein
MPVSIGQPSELVEISKLNGDFKKNYGTLVGAYLYLRSISALRGRSFFWTGLVSMVWSVALAWTTKALPIFRSYATVTRAIYPTLGFTSHIESADARLAFTNSKW